MFRIDKIGVFVAGKVIGGESDLACGIPVRDIVEFRKGDAGVRPAVSTNCIPLWVGILTADVGTVFRRRHIDCMVFVIEINAWRDVECAAEQPSGRFVEIGLDDETPRIECVFFHIGRAVQKRLAGDDDSFGRRIENDVELFQNGSFFGPPARFRRREVDGFDEIEAFAVRRDRTQFIDSRSGEAGDIGIGDKSPRALDGAFDEVAACQWKKLFAAGNDGKRRRLVRAGVIGEIDGSRSFCLAIEAFVRNEGDMAETCFKRFRRVVGIGNNANGFCSDGKGKGAVRCKINMRLKWFKL